MNIGPLTDEYTWQYIRRLTDECIVSLDEFKKFVPTPCSLPAPPTPQSHNTYGKFCHPSIAAAVAPPPTMPRRRRPLRLRPPPSMLPPATSHRATTHVPSSLPPSPHRRCKAAIHCPSSPTAHPTPASTRRSPLPSAHPAPGPSRSLVPPCVPPHRQPSPTALAGTEVIFCIFVNFTLNLAKFG
jgi:hypothetical protein